MASYPHACKPSHWLHSGSSFAKFTVTLEGQILFFHPNLKHCKYFLSGEPSQHFPKNIGWTPEELWKFTSGRPQLCSWNVKDEFCDLFAEGAVLIKEGRERQPGLGESGESTPVGLRETLSTFLGCRISNGSKMEVSELDLPISGSASCTALSQVCFQQLLAWTADSSKV